MSFLSSSISFSFQKAGKSTAYLITDYQHHIYSVRSTIPSAVNGKIHLTNLILPGGIVNMGSHLSKYTEVCGISHFLHCHTCTSEEEYISSSVYAVMRTTTLQVCSCEFSSVA